LLSGSSIPSRVQWTLVVQVGGGEKGYYHSNSKQSSPRHDIYINETEIVVNQPDVLLVEPQRQQQLMSKRVPLRKENVSSNKNNYNERELAPDLFPEQVSQTKGGTTTTAQTK